jgi:hypothetical protein
MAAAGRLTLDRFRENPIYYLSTIDGIHDFKTYLGKDRPNQVRQDPKFYYWKGFKNYIMSYRNIGRTIIPQETLIFNGCAPIISSATIENVALELSKATVNPAVRKIKYTPNNKPEFYAAVSVALENYSVAGVDGDPRIRIPIVIDTEYYVNKAATTAEFVDHFAVCVNKENIADPGQSFLRNYDRATVKESGDEARVYSYPDHPIDSRLGPVTLRGNVDLVEIKYGGVIVEQYNRTHRVYPNSKSQAQGAFEKLLNVTRPYGLDKLMDYCARFNGGTALPGDFSNPAILAQIAAHLIKKRFGDQLQVLSCIRTILYITSRGAQVRYGGRDRPCVFWSYDRVAIAYAILLGIPCVYELANGDIEIYIPKVENAALYAGIIAALADVQAGGACTRENVRDFSAISKEGIVSSTPLTNHINSGPDCLNRYIELHFETTSVYFHPINCIQFMSFLHHSGRRGGFDVNMFNETYETIYNNRFPQLYIEGDGRPGHWGEEKIIETLSEYNYIVFYSFKYKIWIAHGENAGTHTFEIRKLHADGSTLPTDHSMLIYRFTQGSVLSFGDPRAYSQLLEGGGSSSQKKVDPVIHFLSALSAVEKRFLVLSDNRELFTAELKGFDVPPIGYTCYETIFFVLALVKKFKKSDNRKAVTESIGSLFDILKELKEYSFAKELKLLLNMYSTYKHVTSHKHTAVHVSIIQRLVEKARIAGKKMHKALSGLKDQSKMVKLIHKNLPLGILTRQYIEAQDSTGSAQVARVPTVRTRRLRIPPSLKIAKRLPIPSRRRHITHKARASKARTPKARTPKARTPKARTPKARTPPRPAPSPRIQTPVTRKAAKPRTALPESYSPSPRYTPMRRNETPYLYDYDPEYYFDDPDYYWDDPTPYNRYSSVRRSARSAKKASAKKSTSTKKATSAKKVRTRNIGTSPKTPTPAAVNAAVRAARAAAAGLSAQRSRRGSQLSSISRSDSVRNVGDAAAAAARLEANAAAAAAARLATGGTSSVRRAAQERAALLEQRASKLEEQVFAKNAQRQTSLDTSDPRRASMQLSSSFGSIPGDVSGFLTASPPLSPIRRGASLRAPQQPFGSPRSNPGDISYRSGQAPIFSTLWSPGSTPRAAPPSSLSGRTRSLSSEEGEDDAAPLSAQAAPLSDMGAAGVGFK